MTGSSYDYTIRDLEITVSSLFKRRLRNAGGAIMMPGMAGDAFWVAAFEALKKGNAIAHEADVEHNISWTTLEHGCTPRTHLVVRVNVCVDQKRANHNSMEADFRQRIKNLLADKGMTDMNMLANLVIVERDLTEPEPIEVPEGATAHSPVD